VDDGVHGERGVIMVPEAEMILAPPRLANGNLWHGSSGAGVGASRLESDAPGALSAVHLLRRELHIVAQALAADQSESYRSNTVTTFGVPFLHVESDVHVVALTVRLLDRKQLLLRHLNQMNDVAAQLGDLAGDAAAANGTAAHPLPRPPVSSTGSVVSHASDAMEDVVPSNVAHLATNIHATAAAVAASAGVNFSTDTVLASSASPEHQRLAAQACAAYSLFRRQYAWTVLQLESVSHQLEALLEHIRNRVRIALACHGA
jgi:hypothetical protein